MDRPPRSPARRRPIAAVVAIAAAAFFAGPTAAVGPTTSTGPTAKGLPAGTGPGTVGELVERGQLLAMTIADWQAVYGD